ncbi:DEAD/DEAH box helicase [Liberiplasma polymorphum]|uniref:DEAD/DEAH box helicase n=1 Tax=Liberiplasma polymorphum TaxID=3374570 RepID=UPI003771012A
MKFTKNYIEQAVKDLNFEAFTKIQEAVIPEAIKKRDIIGCSQTGSGKTHAFLIPVFERLEESNKDLQVVILSPTRELATQIFNMAKHIASFSTETIEIKLFTGGKDRSKEIEGLAKHQPQIIIGTPGKIHDLAIKENILKTYRAKMLIIDEADMALEIGFLADIDAIARTMDEQLQMMVFSATIPETLQPFLRKYMKQPLEFMLENKSLSDLNLTHTFIKTTPNFTKDQALKKVMESINPYLAIVFVNKKEDVDRIAKELYQNGVNVTSIHGDLQPRKRKQVLKDINRLTYQYIIASDMASRGLDISGISHVINYDLPKDMAFFVHRIGRSGRMGASGETISFYSESDTHAFEFIDKHKITIDLKGGSRPARKPKQVVKEVVSKPRKKLEVKPNYKKKLKQETAKKEQYEKRKQTNRKGNR